VICRRSYTSPDGGTFRWFDSRFIPLRSVVRLNESDDRQSLTAAIRQSTLLHNLAVFRRHPIHPTYWLRFTCSVK
jgi:hypothetical protein